MGSTGSKYQPFLTTRDIFCGLGNLGRPPVVDNRITRLDFHPLPINLLANYVHENDWDESVLLKAWGEGQTGAPEKNLPEPQDAVELVFRSPMVQTLGTTARSALVAIVAFPSGVECRLERNSPDRRGDRRILQVLTHLSPRWVGEDALTTLALLRGVRAGTCAARGSYLPRCWL